jgi:hypothetical protein
MRRKLDLVEKAMAEAGWSTRLANQLADKLGVSKRTIYQYRVMVMEDLAEAFHSEDPRHDRAEFLSRLRGYQAKAARKGAFGSLASMMNVEARVLGVENAPKSADDGDEMTPEELVGWLADKLGPDAVRAHLAGLPTVQ